MFGLWMVVTTEGADEGMRVPADWLVTESAPVEVPTAGGAVDLRDAARAALAGDPRTVRVVDPARPFTVTVARG